MEEEKPTIKDYMRKSIVGAVYRVGASFALDAVYLTAVAVAKNYLGDSMEQEIPISAQFIDNFNAWKFARISTLVVGINFVDYKYDVTNKLDRVAKTLLHKLSPD